MNRKKILPPTYFNSAIALIIIIYFIFPISEIIYFPWNLLGLLSALTGVILNLHTDNLFKKYATTVQPFEESSNLITNGMFRLSRNPMYLGMSLILLGMSIFLGSIGPFFVILIFVILMDQIFIRVEELMLEKKFGDKWLKYKNSVRRWI